jgi:hypothetical protein
VQRRGACLALLLKSHVTELQLSHVAQRAASHVTEAAFSNVGSPVCMQGIVFDCVTCAGLSAQASCAGILCPAGAFGVAGAE